MIDEQVDLVGIYSPPGGGKGTTLKLLKTKYNFYEFSTGDAFRFLDKVDLDKKTGYKYYPAVLVELADEHQTAHSKHSNGGGLVADSFTYDVFRESLQCLKRGTFPGYRTFNPEKEVFFGDGFPRNIDQHEETAQGRVHGGLVLQAYIHLDTNDRELLINRLTFRGEGRADDADIGKINTRLDGYFKDVETFGPVISSFERHMVIDASIEAHQRADYISTFLEHEFRESLPKLFKN